MRTPWLRLGSIGELELVVLDDWSPSVGGFCTGAGASSARPRRRFRKSSATGSFLDRPGRRLARDGTASVVRYGEVPMVRGGSVTRVRPGGPCRRPTRSSSSRSRWRTPSTTACRSALGEAGVGEARPGGLEMLLRLGQLLRDSVPGRGPGRPRSRRAAPRPGRSPPRGVGHRLEHRAVVGDGHPHTGQALHGVVEAAGAPRAARRCGARSSRPARCTASMPASVRAFRIAVISSSSSATPVAGRGVVDAARRARRASAPR